MSTKTLYTVPYPIGYAGTAWQRGEVRESLVDSPNNGIMLELRQIIPINPGEFFVCDSCGTKFVTSAFRDRHRQLRLCDAKLPRVMEADGPTDRQVIEALPERRRKEIKDRD